MPKPGSPLSAWASNALYATGPKTGSAAKTPISAGTIADGHRPGKTAPTAAEQWNTWLNDLSAWQTWLNDGKATAAEDAHIVETSSAGQLSIARAVIGPHSTAGRSLDLVGPTHSNAMRITGGVNRLGLEVFTSGTPSHAIVGDASGASFGDGVRGEGGGAGVGVRGTSGATAGSAGVVGENASTGGSGVTGLSTAGGGDGVTGLGEGAGDGGTFTGGATGIGVVGIGGGTSGAGAMFSSTSGVGVDAQGGGSGAGVLSVGGLTGPGVKGTAGGVAELGVEGVAAASGTTAGAGVRGQSTGDAPGVVGLVPGGQDGYAVVAQPDITDPTRGAFRMVPVTFPAASEAAMTALDGDQYYNGTTDEIRQHTGAAWKTALSLAQGFTFGRAENASIALTSATYVTLGTSVTVSVPRTGRVWFWFSMVLDHTAGGTNTDIRVRNTTDAATLWEELSLNYTALTNDNGIVSGVVSANLTAGSKTVRLEGQLPGGSTVNLSKLALVFLGMLS